MVRAGDGVDQAEGEGARERRGGATQNMLINLPLATWLSSGGISGPHEEGACR